jgi:hypothetical protein
MRPALPVESTEVPPGLEGRLTAWGNRVRGRLGQGRPADITLLLALGGLLVWSMVGNYVGLLGLPALSGADAAIPIYLVGVALLCALPLAIVLAFFVLPRWDMPGINELERTWIAWLRPGVPALAVCISPWINPTPFILFGTILLIGASGWLWSSATVARRWVHAGRYLALQLPGALLTILWLVVWVQIWMRVATFWFSDNSRSFQILVLWSSAIAGWLVYVAVRRAGWRGTCGTLSLVLAGLGLSNPGFPAVMAGALYMLNIGGGRVDIEASGNGPLLCDMGAFGRHFYVTAPQEGCTFEGTTRWIRQLRTYEGPARTRFLRAHRVKAAVSGPSG